MSWTNILRKYLTRPPPTLFQGNKIDELRRQIANKKKEIQNAKYVQTRRKLKEQLDSLIQQRKILETRRDKRGAFDKVKQTSNQPTPPWMQQLRTTQQQVSPQPLQTTQPPPRPTQPIQPQTQQTQQTVPLPRTQPQITNVGGGQAGLENPLLMEKPKQKLSPAQEASIRSHMRFLEAKILEAQNSPNKNIKTDTYEKALEESKNRLKDAGLPVQR